MFGSKMALGPFPLTAKIYYTLFGLDHFGLRVRAMHLGKLLGGLEPPRRILDAGCSGGWYCFYLADRYPSAQVFGIDIDDLSLRNAEVIRQRLSEGGTRISFQKDDLVTFQTNTPFDLICCIDVLEHIVEDEVVLSNLRKALDSRGLLLLHVPRKIESSPVMYKEHVREYTEAEILSRIKRAGFEIKKVVYTFGWSGSLGRKLYFKLQGIRLAPLRAILKGVMAPFLLLLAYGDTLSKNESHKQGLFVYASPLRAKEA